MKKAGLIVYSFLLWTFFIISSIILLLLGFLIWLVTRWFDKRLTVLHLWSCFWASWYIWFNPLWRVRITGRRKIPWRRPCILVSNHQSMLDILVLYHLFVPYKWVSKKENFNLPIIGWNMRLNRYLEIERGKKESAVKLMDDSAALIRQGNSILMFPEGTRYPGGSLGTFKEGAFKMALDNHADIIPILLDGTARALPKKGVILTGFANIKVRVLDPIPYTSFAGKPVRELLNDVRELMSVEYTWLYSNRNPETDTSNNPVR